MERSLSVLLPVENVQATLTATAMRFLEVLPELTGHFELVIVDDASTDATIEVADELATRYPQILAIRHANRLGRTIAVRTAWRQSRGDVVLLEDQGSAIPVNLVPQLWHAMHGHEIVLSRQQATDNAGPGSPAARSGGLHLISRKKMDRVLESLTPATLVRDAVRRSGCIWHEIPFHCEPGPNASVGPFHQDPSGVDSYNSNEGYVPRQPNYLRRLRDFALGE